MVLLYSERIRHLASVTTGHFPGHHSVVQAKSRHIEVDYHFVHELISTKQLQLQYIPTLQQMTYIFTKSLSFVLFLQHSHGLHLDSVEGGY